MAAKKPDFSGINTGRVIQNLEQATAPKGQQGTVTPQEAKERASKLKTQGRKGCKAVRINMAFTPENYDYIRVMARMTGKTMTSFANLAIEKYREQNQELYAQAREIIAGLEDEPEDSQ